LRYRFARLLPLPALALAATLLVPAAAVPAHAARAAAAPPVRVTVFAPGPGDAAGVAGKGFVIDLALDAAPGHSMDLAGSPRFIAPTSPLFKPGPNPAIPGLVVTLSTNKKHTNLANLFQLTGVAQVNGGKEIWTTWLVGKALFGTDVDSTLTVYVVKGLAPTVVRATAGNALLSNIVTVHFHIAGPVSQ